MITDEEFYSLVSLSDMLLGKKTPAELECALEEDGWFYVNERGRIKALDPTGRERALKMLASYFKHDQESKSYPYDTQPPADFLNTDSDPGLCGFRWGGNCPPKFIENKSNIKTKKTTHKLNRNILDRVIDEAIDQAGNMELADVFLNLKELALNGTAPFTSGIDGNSLIYTNNNNKLAKLTKNALGKRLKIRRINAI